MIESLTFLAPWNGILAAAVAVPALLLLYFLKLRRRPIRISSTLLWAKAVADLQVNVPFRWIRPSWLLALQLLALACLCLAAARPSLDLATGTADRLFILIDRSASMSAIDQLNDPERTTRLDQAKLKAQELLDRMNDRARATIIGFASRPESLTTPTRDRGLLRKTVNEIIGTDESGDLDAALRLVRALANTDQEEQSATQAQVILISDGSFENASSTSIGQSSFEFLRIGPKLKPGAEAGATAIDNVGIVALAARRDYEDPGIVRLFVRVQSVSQEPVEAGLLCRLNGETVGSTTLTLAAASTDTPAEASHVFDLTTTEAGTAIVSLTRPDSLASDNTAAVVLKKMGLLRTLIVRPNIQEDAVDSILVEALRSLGGTPPRVMSIGEFERQYVLQEIDLIVFDRVRPATLPPVPSISLGATIPIPGIGVSEWLEGAPERRPTEFLYWQRGHPLMRYVSPGGVVVGQPLNLTVPERGTIRTDGEAAPKTEILASGNAGPLIVLVEQRGVRRLVLGFDLGLSTWLQHASFHVFLKNAAEYLTLLGDENAGRSYRTTEIVDLRPLPGAREISVTGPLSLTRQLGADQVDPIISIGPLPLSGLYAVSGVVPEDEVIAVNLTDPFESRIAAPESVTLGGEAIGAVSNSSAAPREIWHWLVLAAVLLLSLEWMLYATRIRA